MLEEKHFPYLPNTQKDRQQMLETIGVGDFEELVAAIPMALRQAEIDLPSSMSELELTEFISKLALKNKPASCQASFLGGGVYRRFVPSVVQSIISRSEFATAYTPYQPEVSQGTLQAIYEFQSAVCLLTGMQVANASMYDGPTATAEAALMAARLTGRNKLIMCESVNPEYAMVTKTYIESCGLVFEQQASENGVVDCQASLVDETTAAFIVQEPNYFGCLSDLEGLSDSVHKSGTLLIVITEPISLGLLRSPGDCGADIVVGDGQGCGNYLCFGGPSVGYLSCRQEFVRQLPGRICGMTEDKDGHRAFTLTLQTREQHIRRAKATSNICTNQALNALAMLVYLCLMGPTGLKQVAEISLRRAHYLADLLCQIPQVELVYNQPFFNEFAIETSYPATSVLEHLKEHGILGGLPLSGFSSTLDKAILIATTEMNSVAELEKYQAVLADFVERAAKKTVGYSGLSGL